MKKLASLVALAALAIALGGCGTGSAPVAPAAILDSSPPQAPAGLAQVLNPSGVRVLDWSPNAEPDLAGYQIYQYSPAPDRDNAYVLIATVTSATTEWALPVTDEMEITWMRLRALDQSGNRSAESAAKQVVFLPDAPDQGPPADEPYTRHR